MKVDIFNTDKKYNIVYADPPWKLRRKDVGRAMNELKPCPFCGGKARWKYRKPIGWVMCKKCGASSATLSDNYEEADCRQEAIAAWNRRAGNDTNVATNADYTRNMRKGE